MSCVTFVGTKPNSDDEIINRSIFPAKLLIYKKRNFAMQTSEHICFRRSKLFSLASYENCYVETANRKTNIE